MRRSQTLLRRPVSFVALAWTIALGGCSTSAGAPPTPPAPPTSPAPESGPPAILLDPANPALNRAAPAAFKVLFETTQGDFVLEVVQEWAPIGARRLYNLVNQGYYDGVRFFRVIPGFVAQFGMHAFPEVTAAWRPSTLPDDPVVESNVRGTVTFATGGPNTRTVQLFINLADNSRLDALGFSPLGVVTGGMDVVDRLHGGYGEGAPQGRGPDQGRISAEGEVYLNRDFPLLDRIIRARVIEN